MASPQFRSPLALQQLFLLPGALPEVIFTSERQEARLMQRLRGGGGDREGEGNAGVKMLGGEVLSSLRVRPGECGSSGAAGLLVCEGGCGCALNASRSCGESGVSFC